MPFDRVMDTRRMYRWKIDLCAVHTMCAGEWKLLVAGVHSETKARMAKNAKTVIKYVLP